MKIGIVGLGFMGGSIAQSLNQNHHIIAYDINQDSLDYAVNHKIIQEGTQNLEDFFHETRVIYLCLYPQSLKGFLMKHQKLMEQGTVLIEISGVKTQLINSILPILEDHIDLVFTHPIAGSEKVGVKYSKASIFMNANYVIVPSVYNKEPSLALTEKLAREMRFKNVSFLSMEQHDEIIAFTSQLTHVLSLALVNSENTTLDTSKFIGDSYRDLTRISMINEPLWSDLFLENKDHLLKMISNFEESLNKFKNAIESNDKDALKKLMTESKEKRKKIEGGEKT